MHVKSRISLHRADKAEHAAISKVSTTPAQDAARAERITRVSQYWSMFFVNGGFFVMFTLFTMGFSATMPVLYKFAITSILPPALLVLATQPTVGV